jgi:hypothetical protein
MYTCAHTCAPLIVSDAERVNLMRLIMLGDYYTHCGGACYSASERTRGNRKVHTPTPTERVNSRHTLRRLLITTSLDDCL